MEFESHDFKEKRRRVSYNTIDEHSKLDPQDKSYWSPSPPSSTDESMGFNNDSTDSETDSDSESDMKYQANHNENHHSENEIESCSSSTITDDSYSTVTGENNSRVFEDWQAWVPELSSSEDDNPTSNTLKRQRVGNNLNTCFICGGPDLYYNFICICVGCNVGYHQTCHEPQISDSIANKRSGNSEKWFCANCQKKANKEPLILHVNGSIKNVKVDTRSTLNDKVIDNNNNTLGSVNQQALDRGEGKKKNIDDSRKQDCYQEKSNKCLLTIKKDHRGSSDRNHFSSRSQATSDQIHKSKISHKKRRGLLPVIIQPFERRHSTASELRRLFDNCPLSIVNFDDIFMPDEWGNFVEIPSTSVEYIMPSASSISPGTSTISLKQNNYLSSTTTSLDYGLSGKISTLAGKNVVSIRKHASLSPNKNSVTPALKHAHSPLKNAPSPTNKRPVTSSNNHPGSQNKSIAPIKGTNSRSRRAMVLRESCSTPGKSTVKNGRGDLTSDDEYSPSKKVVTPSKPVGLVDNVDADFNIMSLMPPNLIPCLNFGELAFREGTIDRKKTIKRGRVFPVIK
ncbi:2492_t:CDS:1 [Funneliformis geosporum]|uniref:12786_t:CDS:1 n=1 Tax=Funneliformis geosporum TaxID=1117311 RepID=A0A9W4WLG0_9GLOM|nr:2492_t:CDS:1 [Funneliformis geosporum]CAI2170798.1 12786_t:CDS:1 [Funneliformis geosporum]